jgi:hypothetical protein
MVRERLKLKPGWILVAVLIVLLGAITWIVSQQETPRDGGEFRGIQIEGTLRQE